MNSFQDRQVDIIHFKKGLVLFFPLDPSILRQLDDSMGSSPSCFRSLFFVSYHVNDVHAIAGGGEGGIHSEPSLAPTHTLLDAGILDFIFASSARVTPLASLQFPICLTCTLFFLLICVLSERRRVAAGS